MSDLSERPARPGETCTCGKQAAIIYITTNHGDVPYCGVPHATTAPEPEEDHRVTTARRILGEMGMADLTQVSVWERVGRLEAALSMLLQYVERQARP